MKHLRTEGLVIVIVGLLWMLQVGPALASGALLAPQGAPGPGLELPAQASPESDHTFDYWFDYCVQLSGQEALHACNQALLINPHDSATWTNRGQELFQLGQYKAALASNHYALLLKPDYSLGLANQCGILSTLGQYPEALAACDLSLVGDGKWGAKGACQAWNNRGEVLLNLGRYREALGSYERVLSMHPHDPVALEGRQLALRALEGPGHSQTLRSPKGRLPWQQRFVLTVLPFMTR